MHRDEIFRTFSEEAFVDGSPPLNAFIIETEV
jgi:hypothetical protein